VDQAGPAPSDPGPPPAEELIALLRQERADFRNYRRRVADERGTDEERLRAGLVTLLMPLLDDLDRAFTSVPEHLASDPWVEGVVLTKSRVDEAQRQLGVERVGEVGERFDPARHEAVIYDMDPDAFEATVSTILRPGYTAAGALLRPAQVAVRGPRLDVVRAPTDDIGTPGDDAPVARDERPPGG
jgi:molecular chaperone GrpE